MYTPAPEPEVWGEAQLIDALRLNYGEDHADDYRTVIQGWFDNGNGVAIYETATPVPGYPPYLFTQQTNTGDGSYYGLYRDMVLVAIIPPSVIPTVQAP